MQTEDVYMMANTQQMSRNLQERQVFVKQKSDNYKSSPNCYPKSAKRSLPGRCSPSSTWRERCIDFAPEKPALEVDEVRPS
jgi:hypothetical protein